MEINELLNEARKTWGDNKLTLEEIVIRMGVVLGDMNRLARDQQEGNAVDELGLKKEMGNTIYSMIRWCDDLGFDPQECINLAKQAQLTYAQERRK
jgi:hypothetical protein